jgi:hypothetical protein
VAAGGSRSILGSMSRPVCSSSSAAISAWRRSTCAFVPRTAPIDVLLGRERIQRSKIIKQPDVVMLVYSLGAHAPGGPQGQF